jgi:hypothetical protein
MLSNGRHPEDALLQVGEKNPASTSSRLKPHVVWVRSLVPKEKNSALFGDLTGGQAARGSSIIVPIGKRSVQPVLAATSASTSARPRR